MSWSLLSSRKLTTGTFHAHQHPVEPYQFHSWTFGVQDQYLVKKSEGEAGCVEDGEEDDGHEGRGDGCAEQEDQREDLL